VRVPEKVILKPVLTEKSNALAQKHGAYTFVVARDANKIEIKQAIEKLFPVKVRHVRTMIVPGKWRRRRFARGRTPSWKKAIVTLKEGRIDVF
jgi:large subunit ribosomal protein L23